MLHPRTHGRVCGATERALLDLAAAGVQCALIPAPPEDYGRVDGRDEPQQHVDQIDPHSVLAYLASKPLSANSGVICRWNPECLNGFAGILNSFLLQGSYVSDLLVRQFYRPRT